MGLQLGNDTVSGIAPLSIGTAWSALQAAADVASFAALIAISILFWSFCRPPGGLRIGRMVWLFAACIAGAALVHLVDSAWFWQPNGRLAGVVRIAAAAISCATAITLFIHHPSLRRSAQRTERSETASDRTLELQVVNSRLKAEVGRRERIERSLREREEQLRLVLEAGRMGTWEWDLRTNMTRLDERELRLFGLRTAAELIPLDRVFSAVHPEDLPGLEEAASRSIKGLTRYDHEFRVIHPDGRVIWLAGRGDIIRDEEGRPSRMIGVNFEVTERRKADAELLLRDRALHSATNGILITDAQVPDLPIIFANQAFEALTGYSISEVLGRNCRFLQGPDTSPEAVRQMRDALTRQASCHVTILNYRKDGTPFWNEVRITPLRNEAGEVTHYVGVQADVTDRQEFEETLKRAEARAQAANQAKSEFLANMSHEIRTPLTAVLGCADTLLPRLDREEHREMIQMIRNQGRVLLGILNDILDLSKIEAGRLELHHEPCSIVSVIEDVRSLLSPQASEQGLELVTRYDSEMPSQMETDPLRVRQILMNLVGNAIKFTDDGSVSISACCDRESPIPQIHIEVTDTGIGIPPDRLQSVFEAFHQIQAAVSHRIGGTGLGLTISQRLVAMLDGQLSVTSQVGVGTTFMISLPIAGASPLQFEPAEGLTRAADEQHRSRDSLDILLPITVLVAEDTRGIQFMIRRMLEDAGATVAVVENGDRAVAEICRAESSQRPFDVVLMDMQMPVMNGYDATVRLRNLGCRIPIIALTAAAMQGDRERCLKIGCDDYLAKPVDRHALLDAIARQYNRIAANHGTPA